MKLDFLKSLDRIAYLPVALCSFILRLPFQKAPKSLPLVVRPGGMGDLVCFTIACEEMGIDYQKDFEFLIETRAKPWADHLGLTYHLVDDFRNLLKLAGKYHKIVVTEQFFGLAASIAILLGSSRCKIFGFSTNRAAQFFDKKTSYDPLSTHEVNSFKNLIGDSIAEGTKNLGDSRPDGMRPRKQAHEPHRLVVGIAGLQGAPSRQISLEQWAKLIAPWAGGGAVRIVAAPVDWDFARKLAECQSSLWTFEAKNFRGVCDLISKADRFLTIDGGLVHVASFYGVPTTALFTSSRDLKWSPLGFGSKLLRHRHLSCQPCSLFGQVPPCNVGWQCREGLDKMIQEAT